VVPLSTCGICPYRNLPDSDGVGKVVVDPRFTAPCAHRGDVLERAVCNACGMKGQPFDVFACAIHGRCMVRRYRNDRAEIAVCVNCDEFVADSDRETQ
jgi:hypothetical protein